MSETPDEPLPLPEEGPATLSGARAHGKLSTSDAPDGKLQRYVDAVNNQVRKWPVADRARGLPSWQADIALGADMLVTRFWRRKDTPGGVETYGDFGIAYVRRLDPDVAQLLELDDWSKPAVG